MFCMTATHVLHVSLTTEKTGKDNGLQSIKKIDRRWDRGRQETAIQEWKSLSHVWLTCRLLYAEEKDELCGEEGETEVHMDHVPFRPLGPV